MRPLRDRLPLIVTSGWLCLTGIVLSDGCSSGHTSFFATDAGNDVSEEGSFSGAGGSVAPGTGGAAASGGGVATPCTSNAECGVNESCEGGRCVGIRTCTSNVDCAGAPATPICDVATGACVACLRSVDCPEYHDCTGRQCIPYTPCVNSLDCALGNVCDVLAGRCVECLANSDCAMNHVCGEQTCRTVCASDNECTPIGLLCDFTRGYCVRCVQTSDCPAGYVCEGTECIVDVGGGVGGSTGTGGGSGFGGVGGSGGVGGTSTGGSSGGNCNPAFCPNSGVGAPCCVTANGPCGVNEGLGCRLVGADF